MKIGIVAPASPYKSNSLDKIENTLNEKGFEVVFGKSCVGSYRGYLASEDEVRARDIEAMFLDKSIDIVLCIRGGYGTPRLLDYIDYNIIKENKKPFIGFSDITALHIAFNQKSELNTYHGIMAGSCLEWDDFTYNSLKDALNMKNKLEIVNPNGQEMKTIVGGEAKGKLIGGNLSLLTSTMGTDYELDAKGKIIFIEEVGEPIYKIDRMLTQLALGKKFEECEGIIFGDFADCNKENETDFDLEEIIKDRIEKYNKPCIYNLKSGHCMPMVTLPFGIDCILDATNKTITLVR